MCGRPKPEPVLAVVHVDDPLELLFRLLTREGALGEVLPDVLVTVDRSERIEVVQREKPECQSFRLDHVRLGHRLAYGSRHVPLDQPSDHARADGRARPSLLQLSV